MTTLTSDIATIWASYNSQAGGTQDLPSMFIWQDKNTLTYQSVNYNISDAVINATLIRSLYAETRRNNKVELETKLHELFDAMQAGYTAIGHKGDAKKDKVPASISPVTGRTAAEYIKSVVRVALSDTATASELTDILLDLHRLTLKQDTTKAVYLDKISHILGHIMPADTIAVYESMQIKEVEEQKQYQGLLDIGFTSISKTGRADWPYLGKLPLASFGTAIDKILLAGFAKSDNVTIHGIDANILLKKIDLASLQDNLSI